MIFEDIVDTEDDRVVPISQLPHLAVDLTDLNAHPSRSRSKPVLEDLCCFAKTCHGCSCRRRLLALRNSKMLTCVEGAVCARKDEVQ